MKKVTLLALFLLVLITVLSAHYHELWFPGITQAQSVEILFGDSKFSDRAYQKAAWHGADLYGEIELVTEGFQSLSASDAQVLRRLILDVDWSEICSDIPHPLARSNSDYQSLIYQLIQVDSCGLPVDVYTLEPYVLRTKAGLVSDRFLVNDYFSELAISILGFSEEKRAFDLLRDVLLENEVPYHLHEVTIESIVKLPFRQEIIDLIHTRFLSRDFFAILPAYSALAQLGDTDRCRIATTRLSMMVGGDDDLLKRSIERDGCPV